MFRDRKAFPTGINMYVPGMQRASVLEDGQPTRFVLGTPALGTQNGIYNDIASNGVALTKTVIGYTADARYGRTLILTPSADPGNTNVIDIYGKDYLGQPMIERFSGASGSTAKLYGKKAFYTVDYAQIVTASTNAVVMDVGQGFRLGLPFKGDVAWSKEGTANPFPPLAKRLVTLVANFAIADAVAGHAVYLTAPCSGYIQGIRGVSYGGGSTNDPVVTVTLGGVAVAGLTVTVDTSAAGNIVSDTPTTVGYNANNRVRAGDLIAVVGAAAASANSYAVEVDIVPTQFTQPDLTDPATSTTGDPRGTYEANAAYDGVIEIVAAMTADPLVNASGNGGLHGIRHYFA